MFKKENCYLTGSFVKTHGVNGELVLKKENDFLEKYQLESVLVDIDGGLVPFFISPQGLRVRNQGTLRVLLDDIDTEHKALRFVGCPIYIPMKDLPEQTHEEDMDLDLMVGYHIIDQQHGDLGAIEAILDYGGNILFQLTINNQEVLVPFIEENIQGIDEQEKILMMDTPKGLLDIYFEE